MLNVSPAQLHSRITNLPHRRYIRPLAGRRCARESARLAGRRCRVKSARGRLRGHCHTTSARFAPRRYRRYGNPPILPGAAVVWESAHLAGRRCCVEIRPSCRAPLPCGNRPTLPGAGAVWKSAHLAGRCCRVGIGPPCRAPVLCGNRPSLPGAAAVWE
jgi:hypothetical protein